jgi:hypothetical protein
MDKRLSLKEFMLENGFAEMQYISLKEFLANDIDSLSVYYRDKGMSANSWEQFLEYRGAVSGVGLLRHRLGV